MKQEKTFEFPKSDNQLIIPIPNMIHNASMSPCRMSQREQLDCRYY